MERFPSVSLRDTAFNERRNRTLFSAYSCSCELLRVAPYGRVFALSLMGAVVAFLQELRDANARGFSLIECNGEVPCGHAFAQNRES